MPPGTSAVVPDSPSGEKASRRDATREHILDTAIQLFREDGFDQATMRDVASEAEVALGLAYHYFPSKEALVMAYYQRVQREHRILAGQKLIQLRSLRDRLAMLLHTKLDILKDDRKLLGALFRYTGSPAHPLSFLGKATAPLRTDCMGLFAEALRAGALAGGLARTAATLPVGFAHGDHAVFSIRLITGLEADPPVGGRLGCASGEFSQTSEVSVIASGPAWRDQVVRRRRIASAKNK